MRSGVILAGGRSRRFGEGDKAVAELAGRPMVRRVADRLAGAVGELVVNCRADQVEALRAALSGHDGDVRFATDPEPDRGPLAGMAAGLRATRGEYAAVVACDMPFVEPALLAHLFGRAAGHDAAVVRTAEGWYQTTQAVYRAGATADACAAALAAGERRTVAALEALDAVVVLEAEALEHADARTFESLDTPAAVVAAAERFREE